MSQLDLANSIGVHHSKLEISLSKNERAFAVMMDQLSKFVGNNGISKSLALKNPARTNKYPIYLRAKKSAHRYARTGEDRLILSAKVVS